MLPQQDYFHRRMFPRMACASDFRASTWPASAVRWVTRAAAVRRLAALRDPSWSRGDGFLPVDEAGQPEERRPITSARAWTGEPGHLCRLAEMRTRYTFDLDDYEPPARCAAGCWSWSYTTSRPTSPATRAPRVQLRPGIEHRHRRTRRKRAGLAFRSPWGSPHLPGRSASTELIARSSMDGEIGSRMHSTSPRQYRTRPGHPAPVRRRSTHRNRRPRCEASRWQAASIPATSSTERRLEPRGIAPAGPSDASYLRVLAALEGTRASQRRPLPVSRIPGPGG